MTTLVVTGISSSAIYRGVASGRYVKICNRVYLHRDPTARELLAVLSARWPGLLATGKSAAELYLGQELTLPLTVAHDQRLPSSTYFTGVRTKRLSSLCVDGIDAHIPCLAIEHLDDDALAITVLENFYRRRQGNAFVERDNAGTRLSARAKALLSRAALATDSGAERILIRALKERGLRVENNVYMGAYYWDIYLPQLNAIIEIDGYSVHRADNRTVFIRDRWKGNDAVLAGYIFLRYTGTCIKWELQRVVDNILSARKAPVPMPEQGVWDWHEGILREAYPEQGFELSL